MPGEIVGKVVNSRGEFQIRMYTVKEFVQSIEAFPNNVYMQIMYLSSLSIGVPLEEFLGWDMTDAAPVLNRVADAMKLLTMGAGNGTN